MVTGKLEDWQALHRLAMRTELASGKVTIGDKVIPLQVSLNIDNQAIFVEFPDSIKVTYKIDDLINDAVTQYAEYLKQLARKETTQK